MIENISAITLATHDMRRAVEFYRALGFRIKYGGEDATFTSFNVGNSYLNLIAAPEHKIWAWWGRVIFYVSDVDAQYETAVANNLVPEAKPRNADWGERFFHVTDPDGHEISFASPLR